MRHRVARTRLLTNGILAGAAATLGREAVSSLDMVVRGRAASHTHEREVQRLAGLARMSLGRDDHATSRRSGLAALLGYLNGVATVTAYAVCAAERRPRRPLAMLLLGASAMLVADVPMTLLGATDPRRWHWQDWVEDAAPYLVYSLTAVTTLDRLACGHHGAGGQQRRRQRR